jgi:hypothetical protein
MARKKAKVIPIRKGKLTDVYVAPAVTATMTISKPVVDAAMELALGLKIDAAIILNAMLLYVHKKIVDGDPECVQDIWTIIKILRDVPPVFEEEEDNGN